MKLQRRDGRPLLTESPLPRGEMLVAAVFCILFAAALLFILMSAR